MMSFGSRFKDKFATLHPIYKGGWATLVLPKKLAWNGTTGQVNGIGISTLGKTCSKWYWEITSPQPDPTSGMGAGGNIFGAICRVDQGIPVTSTNTNPLGSVPTGLSASIGVRTSPWTFVKSWPSPLTTVGSGTAFNGGDIWGVCMDLDDHNFYIFKNGSRVTGTVSSMQSGTWYPAITSSGLIGTYSINFGATGFAYPSSIPAGFHPGVFDVKSSRLKIFSGGGILSNDRLTYDTSDGDGLYYALGIIGKRSGKWYWEVTPISGSSSFVTGVVNSNVSGFIINSSNAWIWDGSYAIKYNWPTYTTYGSHFGVGDCIGVALDMDAGQITMYKNGVSQGLMFSGLTGSIYPVVSGNLNYIYGTTPKYTFNFGDTPFNYTPPVGYHPGLYD